MPSRSEGVVDNVSLAPRSVPGRRIPGLTVKGTVTASVAMLVSARLRIAGLIVTLQYHRRHASQSVSGHYSVWDKSPASGPRPLLGCTFLRLNRFQTPTGEWQRAPL